MGMTRSVGMVLMLAIAAWGQECLRHAALRAIDFTI
jgi:hypothetical protein